METCSSCWWFESGTGFCRINPPIPFQMERNGKMVTTARFPKIVRPNADYCGSWQSEDDFDEQDDFQING